MTTAPTRTRDPFDGWDTVVQGNTVRTAHPDVEKGDLPLSVLHINGGLVIRPRQAGQTPVRAQPLTEREREVLALVAEGYSNKLIGGSLSISERTVKSHLTYIMTKLQASDRTHAVVTAVRLGWLAI